MDTRAIAASSCLALMCACSAGETTLDPAGLSARDLLGVAPDIAAGWTAEERADARAVLLAGETPSPEVARAPLSGERELVWAVVDGLEAIDRDRRAAGRDASIAVRVDTRGGELEAIEIGPLVIAPAPPPALEPVAWDTAGLSELYDTRGDVIAAVVEAAGAADLRWVEPAPQASFGAAALVDRHTLLINPVLLAAAEPGEPSSELPESPPAVLAPPPPAIAAAGNPYSFFGSVAECAAFERARCEACRPSSTCVAESRDAADGNAECDTLAADDGVGYYLFCVNLALAIATVEGCVADGVPSCPAVPSASNQLVALDANRGFIDDDACRSGLDACLGRIFGEPSDDYPPFADAGPQPPTPPAPRDTTPACGDTDINCDFSPQCDASCGDPSCSNAVECDTGCDDSQSGSSGGCGSSSDSGNDGCGSSSDSGGSCDGCSDSSCNGNSCNGDCSSGDGSGCGDCSGSSNSSCNVGRDRPVQLGTVIGLVWAVLPLPLLGWMRRRERKREVRS